MKSFEIEARDAIKAHGKESNEIAMDLIGNYLTSLNLRINLQSANRPFGLNDEVIEEIAREIEREQGVSINPGYSIDVR